MADYIAKRVTTIDTIEKVIADDITIVRRKVMGGEADINSATWGIEASRFVDVSGHIDTLLDTACNYGDRSTARAFLTQTHGRGLLHEIA